LLLNRQAFDTVLEFCSEGGLRKAVLPLLPLFVDTDDRAILLDADDTTELEEIRQLVRQTKGVSSAIIRTILDDCKTLQKIKDHCEATGHLTQRMVYRLNDLGLCLDSELSISAAAIHDMLRLEKRHWEAGESELLSRGFTRLAEVVGDHHRELDTIAPCFTESSLVFLCDKLVKQARIVSLDVRYAQTLKDYPETTKLGRMFRSDKQVCQKLLDEYEMLTGDGLLD
jgi:hypothetical protein